MIRKMYCIIYLYTEMSQTIVFAPIIKLCKESGQAILNMVHVCIETRLSSVFSYYNDVHTSYSHIQTLTKIDVKMFMVNYRFIF